MGAPLFGGSLVWGANLFLEHHCLGEASLCLGEASLCLGEASLCLGEAPLFFFWVERMGYDVLFVLFGPFWKIQK